MDFTPEQIEIIEQLAGINYSIRQVAIYFDISVQLLLNEYEDKESEFAYHYDRGKLVANADVLIGNMKEAKGTNSTAVQIYLKEQKNTKINNLKNELFGL